jgi:predicted DNA-binding transcriptional regulator YafY
MKTDIFSNAIMRRNKISFLYSLSEVVLEPYYIATEKNGRKVIYGRPFNSSEVKKFEFNRIANIRVLNGTKFSPLIHISGYVN